LKKLKRGLKKAGRGVKRAGKKVGKKGFKVAKKAGKVAVKVHMKPLKLAVKAGKYAMKGVAKLAAKPIVYAFRKLARRRAGYLAFKAGLKNPTAAHKKQAAAWTLGKVNRAGPVGKLAVRILKFVGAHQSAGLGGWSGELDGWVASREQDQNLCGLTGAEIAAAAVTIVAAITKIMRSLNKPGEAPSNPAAAAEAEAPAEEQQEIQPVVEADDSESTEEPAEDESSGADLFDLFKSAVRKMPRKKKYSVAESSGIDDERERIAGRLMTRIRKGLPVT
jgi:ribosomal protein L12E/L44/L45/RPP1/RPP2